ncbi:NAD(P)H-hydrate dehydratase [Psychrobacter frigidicola]|uniref:ADP-dependent (S)-NAD(P)H-hydrate dehydratase n=1 Tax=Psychrobacter frigidicola TaxID=45611 RepID=A0A5C6ZZQ7_9GAMM|nr:NAD(P)H-hydrate dehydratase [Psychrobacter frigidicola]TXD96581.1 NAD(P)H-hydrate dehydratase [Psychrobacter frigidicola]
MQTLRQNYSPLTQASMPIALYSSQQVYAMEQAWFAYGYDSFALMQQAAWQMTQHIIQLDNQKYHARSNALVDFSTGSSVNHNKIYGHHCRQPLASIWVGHGNNGGDGWLIAHYLQQAGWQVKVMTVGLDIDSDTANDGSSHTLSDAIKAQHLAVAAGCSYQCFEHSGSIHSGQYSDISRASLPVAGVYVDAIFGIGLDRAPTGIYKQAIDTFNKCAKANAALVVAVDVPSGLVASTGQVFDCLAIQADVTLCLIARKFGLHTKDGMDYTGDVLDIPLIPHTVTESAATLLKSAHGLFARQKNSYKGSYGHVLIIGGNRVDGSQGMGGAAILSASSAMATGAGKITVACHQAFHGALLTSLPDAMTIDLHDQDSVKNLIKEASVIAIGMGLGRDDTAKSLFVCYVQVAMTHGKFIVIDADGLYHLASLQADKHELVTQLQEYSREHQVCLTPHSGEAAKLLEQDIKTVESDRLAAIKQCTTTYGGDWVLKGAGSLVLEQILKQKQVYVCGVGNAGMATAGMGDVLSGVIAGLLAQQDLEEEQRSLHQAVLIHGQAGDVLVNKESVAANRNHQLLIGQRGLQAQDMPAAIRHVMQLITLE